MNKAQIAQLRDWAFSFPRIVVVVVAFGVFIQSAFWLAACVGSAGQLLIRWPPARLCLYLIL